MLVLQALYQKCQLYNKRKPACLCLDHGTDVFLLERLKGDEYFDGDEAQLKLQKAILTLPEKQRLVFTMKYFDEMKYEDMSDVLGTSVGALKASYHHAVKKVEEFLTKDI